jgi:hypothetical protein
MYKHLEQLRRTGKTIYSCLCLKSKNGTKPTCVIWGGGEWGKANLKILKNISCSTCPTKFCLI